MDSLELFYDGRTVGYNPDIYPLGFYWRGPGYDDEHTPMTSEEVGIMAVLLRKTS